MPQASYQVHHQCALCGSSTAPVLDLGTSPLSNELCNTAEESLAQDRFPLYLAQCQSCRHVQMPVEIDPDRLYRHYPYVSGTSPVFRRHLQELADRLIRERGLKPGDLVVEVGSNDGTLLGFFKLAGMRVVGVDPARNVAEKATRSGIPTLCDYFDERTARHIENQYGPAKLVLALNVFAHNFDLRPIVKAAWDLLVPRGAFVIEVGDVEQMAPKGTWDLVYFDHLHFHDKRSLASFLAYNAGARSEDRPGILSGYVRLGFNIQSIEKIETQGGSLRVIATPWYGEPGSFPYEGEMMDLQLDSLRTSVEREREKYSNLVKRCQVTGQKIALFGAPAKLATYAAVVGMKREDVTCCYEENPLKQGLFVPGTGIPIVSAEELRRNPPDIVLCTAWNFYEDIKARYATVHPRPTWLAPFLEEVQS